MSLKELPSALWRLPTKNLHPTSIALSRNSRRYASGATTAQELSAELSADLQELESDSSLISQNKAPSELIQAYEPLKKSQARRRELPASRYQYRSPRYYRGPLHPHQPPPKSDPASREFVPGPFSITRLEQTFQSTIAPDLMTLTYLHKEPGTIEFPKAERLRSWDGTSPYHKNRPKRGPRGPGGVLQLIEKNINWRNVPKIEAVTVHTMVKGALSGSGPLHVAGIMLQSITGVRPKVHIAKKHHSQFGIRAGKAVALTSTIRGDQAYEFVDKCINLVLPKRKDWKGVEGTTGDNNGNISFGIDKTSASLFPEVEVNYDMYPPQMITGFHVTIHTSANSDRQARLLLTAMGIPFIGKLHD